MAIEDRQAVIIHVPAQGDIRTIVWNFTHDVLLAIGTCSIESSSLLQAEL